MTGAVRATPAQAAALEAIHAAAFPPSGRWSAAVMALQLALPGAFGWIDPAGAMLLARVAADEAEVLTLGVMPGARRRGLARHLLELGMADAAGRGAVSMVLEVGARNAGAHALYLSMGFQTVGQRRGYYADGEDAWIMRAPLPPEAAATRLSE